MKKILGLDLGTTSIGWSYVKEADKSEEKSEIVRLGVRVNPLTTDEQNNFTLGRSQSVNADRTSARSARRNLQRYKLRRDNLIEVLKKIGFINDDSILTESGKNSTHETLSLRAKATTERVEKDEFARILLSINKKRGYKSSRKAKNDEEGALIDGMGVARRLYEDNLTPGQFVYSLLNDNKNYIPDFYRSDLKNEFDLIWNNHKNAFPEIVNDKVYAELNNIGKQATAKKFREEFDIYTTDIKGTAKEKKIKAYELRSKAVTEQLSKDSLAYVLAEVNNNIYNSSGYLGAISDRSKELVFNKTTVGEYLYSKIKNNPACSLKNMVFYRQDYLNEFETIWETQATFYPELTRELKSEIRDIVIFYQRSLKSQKHLVSYCEFEKWEEEYFDKTKNRTQKRVVGHKVIPKSSLLFQEFKIWHIINNIELENRETAQIYTLDEEQKDILYNELNIKGKQKGNDVLKLLMKKPKEWNINYDEIEGNNTTSALYKAYKTILYWEGYDLDLSKPPETIKEIVKSIFDSLGIKSEILEFNSELSGDSFDKQLSYRLWHTLYSVESEKEVVKTLIKVFGFKENHAKLLSGVPLQQDHGSLSSRAIRKITPFLKGGNNYYEACALAGYNHSSSLTTEENNSRELKDKLDLLKKNSLRNPVVEKIINQMINIVNAVIEDDEMGRPDVIRVEMARELKNSAGQRQKMTEGIGKAKRNHDRIRAILDKEFDIKNPTRNDIIRYKLYEELKSNGYKTIYSNRYISQESLFSKEIDIEHIIPKARFFDDSFSNKTLEFRSENIEKGNATAIDFVENKYGSEYLDEYKSRVKRMLTTKGDGSITKAKYNKLLMNKENIPDDFLNRDIGNTQYIAKKAKEILSQITRVVETTTGTVTDRLRSDWGIIDVMKELNMPKYRNLGLVETVEGRDKKNKERIKDWTKRNDHRHHAMDALTVAFTKHSYIQYLNNLNARDKASGSVIAIEKKELYRNSNGKLLFKEPFVNFRTVAKEHIESILISHKAKNKVFTRNINKIKTGDRGKYIEKIQLTPRGQLHKETVYGAIKQPVVKDIKIDGKLNADIAMSITKPAYRDAVITRLEQYNNDPKKAFTGKNSLAKNPVYIDTENKICLPEKVKAKVYEEAYTIRKPIEPGLAVDKVIDEGIKRKLKERLAEHDGNDKKAFSDLDKNPIWLNKDKGVALKRVKISGIKNAVSLHEKRDNRGIKITDDNGKHIKSDFVSTGNNHHIAIYKDNKGKLQEKVVSLFEAITAVNNGLSVIDKNYNSEIGWQFMFTLKSNEMFLFPSDEFDPEEIDIYDVKNYNILSKHLYRVQKIASKDYFFRHHLETQLNDNKELLGLIYKRLRNPEALKDLVKVRINHLGKIVQVGEY